MREGWERVTLGRVSTRVIGRTPPRGDQRYWTSDPGLRPFCSIGDMRGRLVAGGVEGVTELAEVEGKAKRVPAGSLLLSFKLSLGRIGVTDRDVFPNEAIAWVRPSTAVSQAFLALALERVAWGTLGARAVKGKTLNSEALDAVPLLLPPLSEQGRIVDLVGVVDAAIEAAVSSTTAVGVLHRAWIRSFFAVEDDLRPLDQACKFASGGAFSPAYQGRRVGEVPFIKVSDMNLAGNETRIVLAQNFVSRADLAELGVREWPAGTVVFPKVGAALLTEKRRILSRETAFDNNIMGLCAGPEVLPEFLFAFMQTVRLGDYAQSGAVPSVNYSHLRRLRIRVPSMATQEEFCELTTALVTVWEGASRAGEALRRLRGELLAALLSGEHEMPDAYDELLEV